MSEYRLDLSGMSCGSCERIITKIAEAEGAGIKEIDGRTGKVVIECEEAKLAAIKEKLSERGFFDRAGVSRGDFSRFRKFASKVIAGDETVEAEATLMNYAIGSVAVLVLLSSAVYFAFAGQLKSMVQFVPMVLLAIVASVSVAFSYFHCLCYRKHITCQNGMMVGMTMGMVSGLMVGGIIGATNGMFVGSVAGMFFGILVGFKLGRCSGVMGGLEGVMAGLMSGTMGAMISVMMLRDNLLLFLLLMFAVCIITIFGLVYMLYREQGAAPKEELEVNFWQFSAHAFWFFVIIAALIFIVPKAGLVFP